MALPPLAGTKIRERFKSLVAEGDALQSRMTEAERNLHEQAANNGVTIIHELHVMQAEFLALRTKALSLIEFIGSGNASLAAHSKEIRALDSKSSHARILVGILSGLSDDYSRGFLDSVLWQAEAEVAADYLGQAERLLDEGQPGQHDHVPGAVLLGAVFEKALRSICSRQNPPLAVVTGDAPKKVVVLIDDLKKAGVFNELKAKQLRAWADIRNAAAHGEFEKFNRKDVDGMRSGVTTFLGEYL